MNATQNLAARPAGYEVIREMLDRQSRRPPRSALARLFGLSPIRADDASWYTGALGEQAVGRQLARLGPEWTVLHAIPVGAGDSDIDHLLVGPPGVFTLNTKHHRGKKIWVGDNRILVSGQKVDHLRNARSEASRAGKLLSRAVGRTVPVTSVLVFVAAGEISIRSRPRDVYIWTELGLLRALNRLKPTLTPDELRAIVDAAVRETTWSDKPTVPVKPSLLPEFAELERSESSALWVRRAWLALVVVVGVFFVTPALASALGALFGYLLVR